MPTPPPSTPSLSRSYRRSDPSASKPAGLRERHKLDKLERISSAAVRLFGRDGYDATTLRDIAAEADVALGTLGLYARDKRDLVLLIFNRVIPPLLDEGRRQTDASMSLVDNMVAFFGPFYRSYAQSIVLYRTVLGQIYNGPYSAHAEENDVVRMELMGHLNDILLRAMAKGECRGDVDLAVQARSFFYLYFAAVRVWIFRNDPDPAKGLEDLRDLYNHHAKGLLAESDGASVPTPA